MAGNVWGDGPPGQQPGPNDPPSGWGPPPDQTIGYGHQPGQPPYGTPAGPPPYGAPAGAPDYPQPGQPPYGQPPYGQPQGAPGQWAGPGAPQYPQYPLQGQQLSGGTRLNRLAGWSFGLGLGALIIGPLGIVALVFGIVALSQIRRNANQRGRWQAITGIVTGVILGIVGTIAAIAIIISANQLSTSKVEQGIQQGILAQTGQTTKVSCPSNIPEKKGRVFFCTATASDGTQGQVKVTETGGSNIVWSLGNG